MCLILFLLVVASMATVSEAMPKNNDQVQSTKISLKIQNLNISTHRNEAPSVLVHANVLLLICNGSVGVILFSFFEVAFIGAKCEAHLEITDQKCENILELKQNFDFIQNLEIV